MSTVNNHLLRDALAMVDNMRKQAFVGAADPNMTGAPPQGAPAGGGAPPMDPSMMGGAPPMDPSMMGGAPPMDPSMAGGAPPDIASILQPMIQQAVQQAVAGLGGAAGGVAGGAAGGGAPKPKIDVGTEMHQIKMLLGKIADAMGIQMPASLLLSTPADMAPGGLAAGAAPGGQQPPQGPEAGGLGAIQPMKAAGYAQQSAREQWESGTAFAIPSEPQDMAATFSSTAERARALLLRSR